MNRIEANIAGRKIPLKISQDEEVFVKKAIEDINHRIRQYQTEYTQKDIQDCILMALLTFAVEHHKAASRMLDEASLSTLVNIRDHLRILEEQTAD